MIPELEKLGLSEGESSAYLAALELGQASAERIAKKSRSKRTTVYGHIESLREKGLLKLTREGKKNVYRAEEPQKLVELAQEHTKIAESLLPALVAMSGIGDKKPRVLYFEGNEGMRNLYKETLAFPNTSIRSWISNPAFTTEGKWFDEVYRPERMKRKIYTQAILPDTEAARAYHENDVEGFHKTRLEIPGKLTVESDILIFGSSAVALLSWEEMVGMLIESKKIHDTLQSIFEIHWNSLGG